MPQQAHVTGAAGKTSDRAKVLLEKCRAIKAVIAEAEREAVALRDSIGHHGPITAEDHTLVRLEVSVSDELNYLCQELGEGRGNAFDEDWFIEKATDIVELCELAEKPARESVPA